MNEADPRLVYSETEVARMLGLSVRSLQRLRETGEGPRFVELARRRIGYRIPVVEAWLETRELQSTSQRTAGLTK